MKLNKYARFASFALALATLGLSSCSEDNAIDHGTSVITTDPEVENDFDRWLSRNYLKPYNIQMRYKLKDNETSMTYHLAPAEYGKSVQMAHLVKYLCLEAYDEATGSKHFIRSLFPKLVDLIGSPAYNTNGTMVLGTAEGGRKMTLYMINQLDATNVPMLNEYYFKTVHHEFGHIQNQEKPYPDEFQQITPTGYVADSWNNRWNEPADIKATIRAEIRAGYPRLVEYDAYVAERNTLRAKSGRTAAEESRLNDLNTLIIPNVQREYSYRTQNAEYQKLAVYLADTGDQALDVPTLNSLRAGFISPYASSQHREDFVEVQSIFMTDSEELWQAKLVFAGATGRALIQQKYNIVESYLQNDWNINLVDLRRIVHARQANLGAQDLNTLNN